MKTPYISFFFVFLMLMFVQCEESQVSNDNYFSFGETTIPLQSGTIRSIQTQQYPESEATVFEWDIFLSSGNLRTKKNWVRFILNSSSPDDVPVGTYTYDEEYREQGMADYTFYIAAIMRNADSEGQEAHGDLTANLEFSSGTVTVEKENDQYTITFNVVLDNGMVCEGSYSGKLTLREPVTH